MLARLERLDGLRGMVGNGRIDVHGVDLVVLEQLLEMAVADLDAEGVPDRVELAPGPLADRIHVGMRVPLVDGDELGAESQAHDGHVDLVVHDSSFPLGFEISQEPLPGLPADRSYVSVGGRSSVKLRFCR